MAYTDEQKAIINNERSIKYVRLEFPDHEINDIEAGQIYQESLELEESISEDENIVFGKCNGTLFKTRVADFTEDIEKAKMNVYVRFVNEDLGEVNVPFGKYIINQPPERTSDRRWRDITATDYMVLFDVDIAEWYNTVLYPSEETIRTVKYIREALCDFIGVDYENVTMINDNQLIGKSISPETLSGRDLLQNCCEINACFGHFDWNGVLRWIQLINNTSGTPEEDIEYIDTFKNDGCKYEDYSVHEINSVAIIKEDGELAVTYEQIPVGQEKNRYTITGNVLLYGLDQADLESIAESIYNKVSHLSYRPNETEVFSHVYMPLGQLYEVSSNVIVGTEYIDTSFRSYMLKRTIKGIQSMFQTLESSGDSIQPETQSHDIMNTLSILRGKSAVYKRNIDALEIEYRDFEQQTSSRFEQTAESISLEVERAQNAEISLASSIVQTSDSIISTVGIYQETWNERGHVIYWKGYGLDNPIVVDENAPRQPQVGDYYLDLETGKLHTIKTLEIIDYDGWVPSGGGSDHSYSRKEKKIGTWIDGKTLYQKTLEFNNVIYGRKGTSGMYHNIHNLSFGFVYELLYNFDGGTLSTGGAWTNGTTSLGNNSGYHPVVDEEKIYQLGADDLYAQPYRSYLVTIRYTKTGEQESYLPDSNPNYIVCEAFPNNFDPTSFTWGNGDNPIQFLNQVAYISQEDAVYIPVEATGNMAYVDLGEYSTPFTAYVVMKASAPTTYSRMICACASRQSGRGIFLYGPNLTVSSWANDTTIGVDTTDYFVAVLQFSESGVALGGVYDGGNFTKVDKPPVSAGRYITIGRTDIDSSPTNAEPCNVYVRYLGVVKGIDSIENIQRNLMYLYDEFITAED